MTREEQKQLVEQLKLHYELFDLDYAECKDDWENEIEFREWALTKLLNAVIEEKRGK